MNRFGPQGWWPVSKGYGLQVVGCRKKEDRDKNLRPRYHPGKKIKLTAQQVFEIAVGAILTQNTAWPNVEKALIQINHKGLMNPPSILSVQSPRLADVIRSSGYFTQKTKKLKIFARFVQKKARGNLLRLRRRPAQQIRPELLALWGIGPETADSILLYALEKPVFVVDAYTRRIGERLGWLSKEGLRVKGKGSRKTSYEEIRGFFEKHLPKNVAVYQEFHALLVRLAKENCLKNTPLCRLCPLRKICGFGQKW